MEVIKQEIVNRQMYIDKMQAIFIEEPNFVTSDTVHQKWNELGPLKLDELLNMEEISFDTSQ
mgnify:CR=1 FL=1